MKRIQKFAAAILVACIAAATGARANLPVTNNLATWHDAAVGVTTGVSATVTSWADQSGNGHTATQPGATAFRPDYIPNQWNGRPVIRFDGTVGDSGTDTLDWTPFAQDINTTIFMVYRHDPAGVQQNLIQRDTASPTAYYNVNNTGVNDPGIYPFILGNTPDTTGTNVHRFAWSNSTGNGIAEIGIDGAVIANVAHGPWGFLGNWTAIGGPGGQQTYGDVAEVVLYNRVLNAAESQIVENHLSAKYALPMAANDRYAGDNGGLGNYDTEVFGVGRVDVSNQLLTGTAGDGLELGAASLANGEFALAGHKVAVNGFTADDAPMGVRMERVWYLDGTSLSSELGLTFDFSEAGVTMPVGGGYQLLYSSNNAFETSSSPFSILSTAYSVSGDQVTFLMNGASLSDGYFTLAAIPEPSTVMLFGAGGAFLWFRRRAGRKSGTME